ncbi:MAG: hypothetical protein JW888_08750 [Pirellulales bacterium]|nr:hypothetical protein [Pirellulales bacterium]
MPVPPTSEPSPALPAPENSSPASLPPFVPVAVTGPPTSARGPDTSVAIELAGGRVLRLPESISAARLAELVCALESRGSA